MKGTTLLSSVMLLAGALGLGALPLWVGGEFSKVSASPGSNYCHMEFPAIREDTLYTDRPILKDRKEWDIVEFFGPCDYDPLGKEEIQVQRAKLSRDFSEAIGDDCGIFGEVRGYWGSPIVCEELS